MKTFKGKLTFLFISFALIPLLVACLVIIWQGFSVFKNQTLSIQKKTSEKVAAQVESYLSRFEDELKILENVRGLGSLPLDEQKSILSELLYYGNFYEELAIVDKDGKEKIKINRLNTSNTLLNRDRSDERFFRYISNGASSYYGQVRISENSGQMYIALAIPFYNLRKLEFTGGLVALVRLEKLWELMGTLDFLSGETVYIVDIDGRVVAHPNPSVVLGGKEINRKLLKDGVGVGLQYTKAFKGYTIITLGDNVFYVVAERNYYDSLKFAYDTLTVIIFVIIVSVILAVTASLVVINSITKPLNVLTSAVMRIEDGDLSERVTIVSEDEFSGLGKAFNKMVSRVSELLEGLENEIKDRKETETALKTSEDRLQMAIDVANIGIWEYYPQTKEIFYSEKWFELLGYNPNNFKNRSIDTAFKLIHDDDREYVVRYFYEYIDGKTDYYNIEMRVKSADESYKWIHSVGKSVEVNSSGKITKMTVTHFDITSRKEFEDRLKKINAELGKKIQEETNRRLTHERLLMQQSKLAAMGDMIGAIAHQWRQPLNAMGLLIQDLEDAYNFNELDGKYFREMVKSSMALLGHMSQTIDDFRNFFRPDKVKSCFSLGDSILEVINLTYGQFNNFSIRIEILFDKKNIGYTCGENFCFKDKRPFDDYILGYPNEFKHVVLNLLNNSKDAFNDKSVDNKLRLISIIISKIDTNGFSVTIKDNAGGIPEQIADRIFEPYFTTKEEGKGVGIGLYMSKMIIENNMDGNLVFRNNGAGAEFIIELFGVCSD